MPTAVHEVADAHATSVSCASALVPVTSEPAGRLISVGVQTPLDNWSTRPCVAPEVSRYRPTATHEPATAHDTDWRSAWGSAAALAGSGAAMAVHVLPDSAAISPGS